MLATAYKGLLGPRAKLAGSGGQAGQGRHGPKGHLMDDPKAPGPFEMRSTNTIWVASMTAGGSGSTNPNSAAPSSRVPGGGATGHRLAWAPP